MKTNYKILKNNYHETANTPRTYKNRDHRVHTPCMLDHCFGLCTVARSKFPGKLSEENNAVISLLSRNNRCPAFMQ